jgi:antitoxin HicB
MRHSTISEIMLYPANLINDDDKILVTFDDIPEAITFGKNRYEALIHAKDALDTALSFYAERGSPLPKPRKPKPDQFLVSATLAPG